MAELNELKDLVKLKLKMYGELAFNETVSPMLKRDMLDRAKFELEQAIKLTEQISQLEYVQDNRFNKDILNELIDYIKQLGKSVTDFKYKLIFEDNNWYCEVSGYSIDNEEQSFSADSKTLNGLLKEVKKW